MISQESISQSEIFLHPFIKLKLDIVTILIEKDGEKIEVPFGYKYQKFWH
jgi:hypothetical protein